MPENSYVSLDEFKSRGIINVTGSTDDLRMRGLIESASRQADNMAHRHFYVAKSTRNFSGNGKTRLLFPDWDIVAITSLKEDDNGDGTYNITWSSTDFELWPYDADPTGEVARSRPYEAIEVNLRSNGSQDVFLKGQRRYEIAARYGYWEWLDDTGAIVSSSEAINVSTTDTGFRTGSTAVVPSTKVEVGMTILIDSEQMYVTGRSTAVDGEITVVRAVNGTTISSHAKSATIEAYVYPSPIVEAVIEQTARLWTRRGQGYANQIGFQETGQVGPMVTGMDRDVRDLIKPYVKMLG